MEAEALEEYLHRQIPLSKAMGIGVVSVDTDAVVLHVPLAPNINHRETVFGGSATAAAMLCAWALVHTRLRDANVEAKVVIRRHTMVFDAPMADDFTVRSALTRPADWEGFVRQLARKRMARVAVTAVLDCGRGNAATFEGEFVALKKPAKNE
ncbi:MAG: thioesterase domain-containing protein [Gammaproteobacteria bacterium]|nr:thioesterase [Gammaproteobacteria bacterium]